jgi:hypothetical protein
MDALKYIPDNVNVLKTEKGDARLLKTDIFKKIMWFSYPREESWIPLTISRVKEIQQMNREGIIPADLGELVELETAPAKALDYENVVGQDSLTRLDERNRNKKNKNKNRNRGANPNAPAGNQPRAVAAVTGTARDQQPRPDGNRSGGGNNRRNKHRRPNGNNQNRPGGNGGENNSNNTPN